ncbi:dTMP kinase [Qipengyuania sp.]|uniref:dTMP kinase n=1 Tax=Qipengyuania sp. TaxID=2004515 RepID=UPI0035C7E0FC
MTKKGRFIVFEGGEGTGKSTQTRLLGEALTERGLDVLLTREPGGTPGAEAIRTLLLHPPGEGWGVQAEALLFAAARSDHVHKLILPALDRGQWVIADRFLDSSRAYQGMAGGLGDSAVQGLHKVGSGGLLPDLTILLRAPGESVAKRLALRDGQNSDAIGGRNSEYHEAVGRAFDSFAQQSPERFALVEGDADPQTVHRRVLDAIETVLGDPG